MLQKSIDRLNLNINCEIATFYSPGIIPDAAMLQELESTMEFSLRSRGATEYFNHGFFTERHGKAWTMQPKRLKKAPSFSLVAGLGKLIILVTKTIIRYSN